MENFVKKLNWRYAVKKYNSTKKISEENIELLKQAIKLSPSSHGLQPYKAIFIDDNVIRERLKQVSYNQSQITDSSHLIVFAIETNIDEKYVDKYFDNICHTRQIQLEGNLLNHKNSVQATISSMSSESKLLWAANQAYIALGFLLFAAAEIEIDANPMEGFISAKYNEILNLSEQGLSAVVIACIGERHKEDYFQHLKKVRKSDQELFINI